MFTKRKRYNLDDLNSRDPKTLTADEAMFLIMEPIDRYRREQDEANRKPLLYSLAMAVQVVAILTGSVAILVALVPAFVAFAQAIHSTGVLVAVGCGAVVVATQLFFRRTRAPRPWW